MKKVVSGIPTVNINTVDDPNSHKVYIAKTICGNLGTEILIQYFVEGNPEYQWISIENPNITGLHKFKTKKDAIEAMIKNTDYKVYELDPLKKEYREDFIELINMKRV